MPTTPTPSNPPVDKKPSLTKTNITLKDVKHFFQSVHKKTGSYGKFMKQQKNSIFTVILAAGTVFIAGYFGMQLYMTLGEVSQKESELGKLISYDITDLKTSPYTREDIKGIDSVADLISYNQNLNDEHARYTTYFNTLQKPYEYFLQYLYLPKLNIWKNAYTDAIDVNMIGINFLENNPYNDITLIQKWSNFFKNVGSNNEFNKVLDISIEDIIEDANGFFRIPVTVSFEANSKRSFLLLVDKLSLTSNKANISLINEFMYYLWQEIIKKQTGKINSLAENIIQQNPDAKDLFMPDGKLDQDKVIGYHLYNWIFSTGENQLVTDTILKQTITDIVSCDKEVEAQCFYRFREKYRTVPSLAYSLGDERKTNRVAEFKKFFQTLPPLLSIKKFTFDKIKSQDISQANDLKYKGNITLDVYGRGVSNNEVQEIADLLGHDCFNEEQTLSTKKSLDTIQKTIVRISNVSNLNSSKTQDLLELQHIIEGIDTDYPILSNYKKIIRLFEIYRMLLDNNLCE